MKLVSWTSYISSSAQGSRRSSQFMDGRLRQVGFRPDLKLSGIRDCGDFIRGMSPMRTFGDIDSQANLGGQPLTLSASATPGVRSKFGGEAELPVKY